MFVDDRFWKGGVAERWWCCNLRRASAVSEPWRAKAKVDTDRCSITEVSTGGPF